MPNLMRRGPADPNTIDLATPYEVRYWCRELQVTPAELREAVGRVGPRVADVRAALAHRAPAIT